MIEKLLKFILLFLSVDGLALERGRINLLDFMKEDGRKSFQSFFGIAKIEKIEPTIEHSIKKINIAQLSKSESTFSVLFGLENKEKTQQPKKVEKVAENLVKVDLTVPKEFTSLENILKQNIQKIESAFQTQNEENKYQEIETVQEEDLEDEVDVTENVSEESVENEESLISERYTLQKMVTGFKKIKLKVFDERSFEDKNFPASSLEVSILGTPYRGYTDPRGELIISDLPRGSNFILQISDSRYGAIFPHAVEISTSESDKNELKNIKVRRKFSQELLYQIAGLAWNQAKSSFCGEIKNFKATEKLRISSDHESEGIYYFNRFGYFDPKQKLLDESGRFCVLNSFEGPVTLSLYDGDDHLSSWTIAFIKGFHQEQELDLNKTTENNLFKLMAMPSAHEQLRIASDSKAMYRPIDQARLSVAGYGDEIYPKDFSWGVLNDGVTTFGQKMGLISQDSEMEQIYFRVDANKKMNLIPLLPQGFVEDMSIYASVTYDQDLGSILSEYKALDDIKDRAVNMKLVSTSDPNFEPEGFYYSAEPITRAMFFNVPSGIYSLIIETKDGEWVQAKTVFVYNQTMSYVGFGSEIQY